MEHYLDVLMQWLNHHQNWILFFLALLSFLECLALVGIVVAALPRAGAATQRAGRPTRTLHPASLPASA